MTLRLAIGGFLLLLLPGPATALGLGLFDGAETGLEVVEDKADRRLGRGRAGDRPLAVPDDEDAAGDRRRLELRDAGSQLLGRLEKALGACNEALCGALVGHVR